MIEPEDFMILGISALHTGRAIEAPSALDQAAAETIAGRLSELRLKPVPGAYDSSHLQQIHARIFQDLFPWAGQFREPQSPSLTSSLDTLVDRLARDNRLKGLDGMGGRSDPQNISENSPPLNPSSMGMTLRRSSSFANSQARTTRRLDA